MKYEIILRSKYLEVYRKIKNSEFKTNLDDEIFDKSNQEITADNEEN